MFFIFVSFPPFCFFLCPSETTALGETELGISWLVIRGSRFADTEGLMRAGHTMLS